MNGIVNVNIKGQAYPLKFGMQAFLIFQDKSVNSNVSAESTEGRLKAVCDLFFAGLAGHSIRNEKPVLSYPECVDLFDELCMEPDFNDQVNAIWNCFNESVKPLTEPVKAEPIKKKEKVKASQ